MMTEAGALTVGQEALWYLHRTEPDSSAYNVVFAVRLLGALDVTVLCQAVGALVGRHDVLRSRFPEVSGRPRRVVEPPERLEFRVADLGPIDDQELHDHVHAAAAEPFDLASGAFRVALFLVEDRAPVLLLVSHHIVTDFVSQGVVMNDLLALYGAMLDDREPELRRLRATYDDFVRAEAATLASERGDVMERFWRQECAGAPTDIRLPAEREPEPGPRAPGATVRVPLGLPLLERVEELAREIEVSPFSCLLAAFEALLARYTGQDDFLLACPTMPDMRRQRGVAGYYVNPVLVHSDVGSADDFTALARAVHDRVGRAMIHRDRPFPLVVRALAPARQAGRAQVGQVAFSLQAAHRSGELLNAHASGESGRRCVVHGVEVAAFDVPQQEGQFDLSIEVVRTSDDATAVLKYDTALFDRDAIAALGAHFGRLLLEVLARPSRPVGDIELLDRAEVDALLRLGSGDSADVSASSLLHLLRARATERPEAVAVQAGRTTVSYARLARLVNGVAVRLASGGVRRGDVVAVATGRSALLPAVALGVMAAGATYLPIDPALPAERIDFMLADSSAAALVRSGEGTRVAAPDGVTAVDLASVDEIEEVVAPPAGETDDRVPAYLIYTSGSTGRPKAVAVGQAGLANLADWQRRTLAVDAGAVVLQYASPGFDASVWELAMALGSGATLAVPDRGAVAGDALAAEIVASRATHVTLPPSVLATFAPDQVPGLRQVIAAGEACPGSLARTWAAHTSFYNAYGPTETTVCATAHRCGADEGARPPIGRPLQNLSIYVLDDGHRLAPRGVVGELAVGGPAVAFGYLNRPDLTDSRFVDDPWRVGGRLYLTGDRARWRSDGTLEFHGRGDDQVKIRGQRVELREIDAVLTAHPAVGYAVTITTGAGIGMRLVAYVTGADADPAELKGWAAARLAAHMVPATVEIVDSFPLTSSGKVDRRALARSGGVPTTVDPPSTEVEERLVGLLAEELGLDRVGAHEDFFMLGGHSLLAARLAFRIREAFGTEVPLADILACPTAAGLARLLDGAAGRLPGALPRAHPAPGDVGVPFPLTDVQQAYLLGRRADFTLGGVSAHGYFEVEGPGLDPDRLTAALNAVVRRHPMLRAVVVGDRQRVLTEVDDYRIQVADLRTSPPAAVEAHLDAVRAEMSHQVLPADRWPLFDIRLMRAPGDRSRLHLSIDGLIADGTGLQKILAEWHDAYDGRDMPPAEEVTFRDYVIAERALEDTELYQRSRSYWQQRLDTLPSGPALPAHPGAGTEQGTGERTPHFDRLHHHLPATAWQALLETARRSGLTPSAVALAAYATTLAAWSSSRHFTLTLTMFNRLPLHPSVDRIVGDFTAVTLLEIDLRESRSFEETARAVQRQLWSDLDHRYYSGIRVKRDLARRGDAVSRGGDTPVVFTSALDDSGGGWGFEGFGELVTATSQTPQVSLDHVVVERDGGLDLVWNVVRSEFPDGLPDAMFADYRAALERLAYGEEAWHEARRDHRPHDQILEHRDANDTAPASGRLPLLHEPFFAMAARQPDAVAVRTPYRAVTYRELERDALRIAARLAELDLPSSSLVAVSLPKGSAQVAAVLGVLRAGLAYVPVSPALPRERQETLIREARPGAIVCTAGHPAAAGPLAGPVPVIEVDRLPDTAKEPPEIATAVGDLAYVIYTSGSTGTPKGVMIDHGGAMNTILDINRRHRVTSGDSVLGVSSLSFDLSVYDVFGVLAAGGTIVLPDPRLEMDPAHWRRLISDHGVTLWNSVPALMRLLVQWDEIEEVGALASLTTVMLSGDWIPVDLPGLIRQRCPKAEVISMGGATEASIWSVFHRVGERRPDWSSVPYGRPLAGQQLHVLDESMTPSPTWVPGDLYIGGRGVALGYLHDAGLTDAKFVRHPRWGTRLYRTGDRARWRPGGLLEFLGRDDLQVKINGNRIELGEIEAALAAHPSVEDAVVSAPSVGRDRVLVAHVVPVPAEGAEANRPAAPAIDADGLRDYLRRTLPAPMIPSRILAIPRLPLTSNGKIDRARLTRDAAAAAARSREPDAGPGPELDDPLARDLAEIWSTVLERTVDSTVANFFVLGGDSLSAVRVLSLANESHGTSATMSDLFEAPTIGQFAARVRASGQHTGPRSAPTTWVEEEL